MAVTKPEVLKRVLRDETRRVYGGAGAKVAVVGVSGGVNSSLALAVAADALGVENVAGVYIGAHSSPRSLECARVAAKAVGVKLVDLDVTDDVNRLWEKFRERTALWPTVLDRPRDLRLANECSANVFQAAIVARGSIRSCIRATILDSYGKSFAIQRSLARGDESWNVLIMGTGDEGEDRFFRFFNKRGDGAVDVSLLSSLSKNEHRQAAVLCYGIPREVAYQRSGPDLQHDVLMPGQDAHYAEEEMSRCFGAILTYGRIDSATDRYAAYGTLEWIAREDDARGVVTGIRKEEPGRSLLGHYRDQRLVDVILAARRFEAATRHKTATQAMIDRRVFLAAGAVVNGPDPGSELSVSFELV
jgi:NH3-dependent NAD+ synthetase